MSKKKIIIFSVISAVLLATIIVFASVFCLRSQSVVIVDGSTLSVTNEEIITVAGLKRGQPILFINKDKAIARVEQAYPYVKVVQIKTTGAMSIEIRVRSREAMYYVFHNHKYFFLDEDLKVLNVVESAETVHDRDLIQLTTKKGDTSINDLGITNNTKPCDFVGNNFYKNVMYNLFTAMHNTVKIKDDDSHSHYVDRAEIRALLENIEFGTGYTLNGSYPTMILSTTAGVRIIIADPQVDLQRKVNVCFATYNALSDEQRSKGSIKFIYDKDGNELKGYQASNS